jgi:heptosyltransferase-1
MLRILLVKTSSLGDVVHNLPVVSDILRHMPEAVIDWVVEEPFAPLPALHPGVHWVIPVAVRRWRKALFSRHTRKEFASYRHAVGSVHYDAVIDTQGLVKSALLARAANLGESGVRHGFDAASAREGFAARFYGVHHAVAQGQHAVMRNRLLVAAALGYRIRDDGSDTEYGIRVPGADGPATLSDRMEQSGQRHRYVVLLHGTSRADKCWPEDAWIALGQRLSSRGITCVLPWGSTAEQARSRRIADAVPGAMVPDRAPLDALAGMLAGSAAVVGVDTGLMHLAVALGRPVVAIFTATDPNLTGAFGSSCAVNLGSPGKEPQLGEVLDALTFVMPAIGESA